MDNKYEAREDYKAIMCKIADVACELNMLIEKVNVLTEDIYINFFYNSDLKSERGKHIAEYDYQVAAIKSDMIRGYMTDAVKKSNELLALSDNI